jgi:hypothetical protein
MAQALEHLLCKHETWSSNTSATKEKKKSLNCYNFAFNIAIRNQIKMLNRQGGKRSTSWAKVD